MMNLRLIFLALAALPLVAAADLTLTGRSTVMSMNMPSTSQEPGRECVPVFT